MLSLFRIKFSPFLYMLKMSFMTCMWHGIDVSKIREGKDVSTNWKSENIKRCLCLKKSFRVLFSSFCNCLTQIYITIALGWMITVWWTRFLSEMITQQFLCVKKWEKSISLFYSTARFTFVKYWDQPKKGSCKINQSSFFTSSFYNNSTKEIFVLPSFFYF